ncbi:MAG TPA: hypothetical protein DCQ28_04420 [Bacteroidetes bacterium]|nr:hypothetical protein [Bacteroidota bacterium]
MKKTTVIFFVIMSSISFLQMNCKDEPPIIIVPPTPTNCDYPVGNRNFTWRLDTIAWWPSFLGGLHAFSDSDAWVMGDMHGPVINGQNTSYVGLHWNGKTWNEKIDFLDILMKANDVTGDSHFMAGVGWRGMPEGILAAITEFDNSTKKWKTQQFQTQGELRSVWTDGKGYFIAVGDNGIVYTKDGYTAEWVYQKTPTEFNFTRVTGISKTEVYARAVKSLPTGQYFQQIWKYIDTNWIKLMDNENATGMPIQIPEAGADIYDVAVYRCPITDSLYLYVVGSGIFEFTTKGNSIAFVKREIASFRKPIGYIALFSPGDYWISSIGYFLYHSNGSDMPLVQPIPAFQLGKDWGAFRPIKKSSSGKIWLVLEMDSQVYAVIQGIP